MYESKIKVKKHVDTEKTLTLLPKLLLPSELVSKTERRQMEFSSRSRKGLFLTNHSPSSKKLGENSQAPKFRSLFLSPPVNN